MRRAYDMAALKMRGQFARRNFEDDDFSRDSFFQVTFAFACPTNPMSVQQTSLLPVILSITFSTRLDGRLVASLNVELSMPLTGESCALQNP